LFLGRPTQEASTAPEGDGGNNPDAPVGENDKAMSKNQLKKLAKGKVRLADVPR
jgi:hypothetical protein